MSIWLVLGRRGALVLMASGLMLSGCATTGARESEFRPQPPAVWVLYYGYGPALAREDVTPVPDYNSWPDERMEKDFARLAGLGADCVLVGLNLDAWAEDAVRERYERLMGLVAANPRWPRVVWWLEADTQVGERLAGAFMVWAAEQVGGTNGRAYGVLMDKRLLVLSPALAAWPGRHPAFAIRFTHPDRNDWTWRQPAEAGYGCGGNGSQAVVHVGTVARRPAGGLVGWLVGKSKGEKVRSVLNAIMKEPNGVKVLCLASWNDFASGDFIEPTRDEGDGSFKLISGVLNAEK